MSKKIVIILFYTQIFLSLLAFPQALDDASEDVEKEQAKPPVASDETSIKLINNYTTVIGGEPKIRKIENIVATGVFEYGNQVKEFKLTETIDGRRCLVFEWRFMGRNYRETIAKSNDSITWKEISKIVIARDGKKSWERVFLELKDGNNTDYLKQYEETVISNGQYISEKRLSEPDRKVISGKYGEVSSNHFNNTYLLLHPIFRPDEKQLDYHYAGLAKVSERKAYIIKNRYNEYYFDREKSFLTQWGGDNLLGGNKLFISYTSASFKRFEGVLFPVKINMLAEGQLVGSYDIQSLEINADIDDALFRAPQP